MPGTLERRLERHEPRNSEDAKTWGVKRQTHAVFRRWVLTSADQTSGGETQNASTCKPYQTFKQDLCTSRCGVEELVQQQLKCGM